NNIALLSGDVMLVKAYELLGDCEDQYFKQAFQAFNQCAAEVCEGQQIDMNFEAEQQVHEQAYINMIRLKTAVLLGFSLKLGALLAGASQEHQQKINDFGVNIGIGFQIKDDLLDVYADQSKFGKQVGGDIMSNKKTFLLIKALENANPEQKQSLDHWISVANFDKNEKVKAVIQIYDQLKIKELAEQKMQEFFAKGFKLLEELEVSESQKQFLRKFTEDLIEREN
ncbi:MAG: polyprenyl synthetase family protein, partial [Bacteroidetes bacterium]